MGTCEVGFQRRAVEAFLANKDEMAVTRRIFGPYGIEMVAEAGTHALHQKPHGLIGNIEKTFDAEHIMLGGHRFEAGKEGRNVADGRHRQSEAVEIVVVVTFMIVVAVIVAVVVMAVIVTVVVVAVIVTVVVIVSCPKV